MSEPKDPPRLHELGADVSPRLSALFDHATRDVPTAAEMQSLTARLAPLFVEPPAPKVPRWSKGAKLAAVGGGLGAVALLVFWLSSRERADQGDTPTNPAPSPSATAPFPAPTTGTTAATAPADSSGAAVSAATATLPRNARPSAEHRSLNEAELLERARRALTSDPARALALTRLHQAQFPRGALAQEREVIAIDALRRLGRGDEAGQRASRFGQQYPGSAHRRAVEASPSASAAPKRP